MNKLSVYLAGEIHSDWREQIRNASEGLNIEFTSAVTDHDASDDCGVAIMGAEPDPFWHDHKGAKVNAIRTRTMLSRADVVVVRFGDQYKQWNAAFDAGQATAMGTPLITLHSPDHRHALKEIDGAALATCESAEQVAQILRYVLEGTLPGR